MSGDDIVQRLRCEQPPRGCMCQNCEAADEIERLRALADQLVHLLPHFHLSQRCQPPQGVALEDWCTECHVVAAYREARRER